MKAVGVIPDPETFIFELEPVDRFMILGMKTIYLNLMILLLYCLLYYSHIFVLSMLVLQILSDFDYVFLTFLSFAITASDGVWEFITSGEAVDIVQKSLSGGADCDAGTVL